MSLFKALVALYCRMRTLGIVNSLYRRLRQCNAAKPEVGLVLSLKINDSSNPKIQCSLAQHVLIFCEFTSIKRPLPATFQLSQMSIFLDKRNEVISSPTPISWNPSTIALKCVLFV